MKKIFRLFVAMLAILSSVLFPGYRSDIASETPVTFNVQKKSKNYSEDANTKNIFYLSSYSLDWFSVSDQINGFLNGLQIEARIDYHFLDAHNNNLTDYIVRERKIEEIKNQIGDKVYDIIIASDDEALRFLDYLYSAIENLQNAPVLFHGVDYSVTTKNALVNPIYTYINGIMEAVDFEGLLKICSGLLPKAKKVNLIYENTYIGNEQKGNFMYSYNNLVKENFGQFKDMGDPNYIIANSYSKSEFSEVLSNLKKDEINLFAFVAKDRFGHAYDYRDIIKLFNKNVDAPVFCINDFGVGQSFVGGSVYSHYLGGQMIGKWTNEILTEGYESFDANHISTDRGIFVKPQELMYNKYDGVLLNKYNLNYTAIPNASNTIILNENEILSFFSQYKEILVPTIIGLSVFFAAAIWILWLYGKEREKNKIISTDRKKLEYLASHDYLTGLRSRQYFSRAIAEYFENKEPFFLVVMDIDGFKYINDTYGHLIGDEALIRCSKFFKSISNDKVKAYRVGGDEFVITIKTKKKEDVISLIQNIRTSDSMKFSYKEHNIEMTFSMGAAQYPYDGLNEVDLVGSADSALYYIKEHGKNNFAFYDKQSHDSIAEIGSIERDIKVALANDGFTLHYQPEIDLHSGKVLSFEAFIRFKDKKIYPAEFISLAEKNGLIVDIGRYVLEETAYFLERMRQKFGKMVPVSVNFSFSQLKDKHFLDEFKDMMFEMDIPLELIKFEVSEYSLKVKPESYEYFLNFVEKNNIDVILDKFGTSLSSIGILKKNNVKKVKFDRAIIKALIDEASSEDSIKSIVAFLHSFNVKVCAVGVETEIQLKLLKEGGCDSCQGYLFEKPIPEDLAFEKIDKVYKLKK